ncbi:MAG: hypothetical protein QOF76_4150 [Solirubrobacteraceae bacterium]|nr:hypothetical protein [Solirubrobacteraceae bacterium]
MRLRVLVPRRRRRRSLCGLAAALALAGCGGSKPAPEPPPQPRLAIGITEENPNFLAGDFGAPFAQWRAALTKLDPTYYRLVIDWAKSVNPDGSFNLTSPQGGCLRTVPPCAGWFGVRQQLQAVKAAQERSPGHFRLMAVIFDTPEQQAAPPSGCEPKGLEARSRAPEDLAAYQDVIRQVNAEAARQGVKVEFWSPWNEPNHPYFLSPQRTACDPDAPSASVPTYVALARAMQQVLEPGQQLVLGELGGVSDHPIISTELTDFVRQLPSDLVCGASIISVHGYAPQPNPVPELEQALPCDKPIWVTETGTKTHDCPTMAQRLKDYAADPRVKAVFQYTLREDNLFPTGLVTTDLTTAYPLLELWQSGVCL